MEQQRPEDVHRRLSRAEHDLRRIEQQHQQPNPQPQHWGAPQPQQPKPAKPRRWPWVAGAVGLAFFVGLGIGLSDSSTTASEPLPAPTVTVTAPGETVSEEVTPPVCEDALAEADRIVEAFRWQMDWIIRYLSAASELDASAMGEMNGEIGDKAEQYAGVIPTYEAAAEQCRAAG